MSKMWKPGTSKPPSGKQENDASKKAPPSSKHQSATANGSSPQKKKLSGATMGMRFMQRKMEAEAQRQKTSQQQRKDDDEMDWTATKDDDQQGSSSQEETPHVSQQSQATPSEMYGAKSDLPGRRSFGGFRPHVSDSYTSSCKAYETGITNTSSKQQHISDEELLRRYKDYRSGKGDMVDSAAAAPIGNLDDKLKKRSNKKRKKNESPNKSEKRKR